MPMLGRTMSLPASPCHQNILCYRELFAIEHWQRACTPEAVQGGRSYGPETDSAANQFGAPEERRRPARDISVVWALSAAHAICQMLKQESDYEDR